MPLPRFDRLPPSEQRRIIDVAVEVFATDGVNTAAYNKIISAAGISKSSAYNYFDGRDDLLDTALGDVAERLKLALGTWTPASTSEEFWRQLAESGQRLEQHCQQHPHDLSLIDPAFLQRTEGAFAEWINNVVDNGIDIKTISVSCDRDLLVAATSAVMRAADEWAAAKLQAGVIPDPNELGCLIRNLWAAQ